MKLIRGFFLDFRLFLKNYIKITYHILGIQLGILVLIIFLAAIFALIERIRFVMSIYFAFITALTVGYGDITPQTILGRILSVLIGYLGLTFFGILIGVAAEAVRRSIGPLPKK